MMIFQGVDRATNVMKKMMAGTKALHAVEKANQQSARAAQNAATAATNKQASALARVKSVARGAFTSVQNGAAAATQKVTALYRATDRLGRNGVQHVRDGAGRVTRGVGLAVGLAASVAGVAGLAANQFLGTAKAFESYNIQLATLEGSAAKGKQAMAWISKFAVDTPLQLDQVVESYRSLRTFGIDPTNGTLQALTDTMAASGKGAEHLDGLIIAFGQAWTKGKLQGEEAMQMLERGIPVWDILSQKYGKTTAELQELASKGKLGREAITALIDAIGQKNAGASANMAATWEGITNNLADAWQKFELAVMNAGLFDFMKGKLQLALDTVNAMAANGTLDAWAKATSDRIVSVLDATWRFATGAYGVLEKLGNYLSIAADYAGGWENLAYVIGALAFAPTLIATAAGLMQIVLGLSMIAMSPAGLALAGIAALAWLLVDDWGAAFAWIGQKVAGVMGAFGKLRTLIRDIFADPGQALSKLFAFDWSNVIPALSWTAFIPALLWPRFVARLAWHALISPLAWRAFVIPLRWASMAGPLVWNALVTPIRWLSFVSKIAWGALATRLSWSALITPLRWVARFIPVIGWAALAGELLWSMLIKPLGWDKYISIDGLKDLWSKVTAFVAGFQWPKLPDFNVAFAEAFESITADLNLAWSNVVAWFGSIQWPSLPTFELPKLPDIEQWISGVGDRAFAAMDAVSARVGAAWGKVKSAFTFGGTAAPELNVADPAAIKASQAAVASLKADMQSVTSINTGPAMAQLGALEAAGARVKASIISSLTQAQAYVSNLSFYNQGAALMDTMAAGIRARAGAVTAEIQKMAQQVRNMLPSSPAKTGPLSDIHRLKFGETIASSIRSAPMVKAMRAATAATMAAATPVAPAFAAPSVPKAALAAAPGTDQPRNAAAPSADAVRAKVAQMRVASAAPVTIKIDYKPTISITGDAKTAQADFARQLQAHSREIEKLVDEAARRAARRTY